MKKLLFLPALVFCSFGYAQITKTAGIPYTATNPSHTPSASGSAWSIDTVNLDLWVYYNNTWNLAGERIQTISGCAAPAYTPGKGQSLWVVNGCDSLYYYRSSAWRHINPVSGGGVTDGDKGDITVSSSGTVWNIDANVIDSTNIAAGSINLTDINRNAASLWQTIKWNGTQWVPAIDSIGAAGSITGSGAANSVTKWTGTSTLGNSVIKDNGTTLDLSVPTGIGVTPTAILHLKAGTASANTAPLKFNSGSLMTSPEAGAVEYAGDNLRITSSTNVRYFIAKGLNNSDDLDFPETLSQESSDLTITVTGAGVDDMVSLAVNPAAIMPNTCYTAWVSTTNNVTVRFNNYSTSSADPASGKFVVYVIKL